jgi:hypothetical protein
MLSGWRGWRRRQAIVTATSAMTSTPATLPTEAPTIVAVLGCDEGGDDVALGAAACVALELRVLSCVTCAVDGLTRVVTVVVLVTVVAAFSKTVEVEVVLSTVVSTHVLQTVLTTVVV